MATTSIYKTKIPANAWIVLAILGSITTMTIYAETMVIPAIPNLIKEFHISYSMSSWILTAYLIHCYNDSYSGKTFRYLREEKSPTYNNDNLRSRCFCSWICN